MKTKLTDEQTRCENHECKLRDDCLRYKQLVVDFHQRKYKEVAVYKFSGDEVDEFGFVIKCSAKISINEEV